ncbi:biliverdin-producing heme oxygenase [Deinococcus aquaedulcis]|uniref:biliverdin-producing heme oxygenase n=1 Tax=Deinococcus aquaedulcis TaxID=2840455 RepID=UPI001C838928|nr:biliverdin-producing heme oxygenase [Deinococcus aquaedulcis]
MIMTQLKEATAALHDAVEAQMPVLRPDLTRAEYTQLLSQVYWAVAPLDAQVQALDLPGAFLAAQRQKTPLLRRDLAALGAAVPPLPLVAGPALDLPGALGALYVLEGATLGGQVISRHLQGTLGLSPEAGGAYFHGYGRATGAMWRAFGEAMTAQVTPAQAPAVLAGAQAAFARFAQALSRVAA